MERLHESAAAAEVAPLAFPFTRGRYVHRLLARVDRVCLVERVSTHPDSHGSVHYEVILVRSDPARTLPDGERIPPHEHYPATRLWGTAGWTYTTHRAAERAFAHLAGAQDGSPTWSAKLVPPVSEYQPGHGRGC
jgi:hypothetical protein